jgi:hypothetical protein
MTNPTNLPTDTKKLLEFTEAHLTCANHARLEKEIQSGRLSVTPAPSDGLLSCPFCQSFGVVDAYYLAGCSNVDCQLYRLTMTPEQWNTRALTAGQEEVVDTQMIRDKIINMMEDVEDIPWRSGWNDAIRHVIMVIKDEEALANCRGERQQEKA